LIPIESDIVLLRQVLINLVGNALRFTHAGSVTVVAIADPQTGAPTKIEVRDTGVGIPLERQRAVFEPFEQGDVDTHLSYGGTGLGLSISKAICDALGYGLTLVSEPGKGSTFAIHLASAAGQLSAQPVDSDGQLSPSHLKAV
jgi:signal transduction histidine kinase